MPAREFARIGGQGGGIAQGQVGPHTAGNPGLFDFGQGGHLAQQAHMLTLWGGEKLADGGITAACALAAACVAILYPAWCEVWCKGRCKVWCKGLVLCKAWCEGRCKAWCEGRCKAWCEVWCERLVLVRRGICPACGIAFTQAVQSAVALPHVGCGAADV